MMLFACAPDARLTEIGKSGFPYGGSAYRLYRSLTDIRRECDDKILVIELDGAELAACTLEGTIVLAAQVPAGCFRNMDPYLPPKSVTAGGGLVVRRNDGAVDVVGIHRRGVWDLPKGKLDPGETVEECARREVCEELGIEDITIVNRAGETTHGYPRGGEYHIKTTYWFWMRTESTRFVPQALEGIERAEWMPWSAAAKRMGYPILKQLMGRLDPDGPAGNAR